MSGMACSHQPPPPRYYTLPEDKVVESRVLETAVKPDSLDLHLLEWAVFYETNVQRGKLGLQPLRYEGRLQREARAHCREMIELEYFDHTSPVTENETVQKRLEQAGIKHGAGGENIAIHPATKKQDIVFRLAEGSEPEKYIWRNNGTSYTYQEFAADLVERFLHSAPHRRNILNRGYTFLGVGAVPGRYNQTDVFYVTQNFSSTNY